MPFSEYGGTRGEGMQAPRWSNRINWNTIIIVVGLFANAFWAGVKYSEVLTAQNDSAKAISALQTDMSSLQTSRSTTDQDIDNLKYRMTQAENRMTETSSTLREQEKSIGQIASDVRATRLLVECIAKKDCTGQFK